MPISYDEEERIYHKGFRDGWVAGHNHGIARPYTDEKVDRARMKAARSKTSPKQKRGPSAYNKKYAAAFKKVAPKFKLKNGGWVKDGFKRAGAAARKLIK